MQNVSLILFFLFISFSAYTQVEESIDYLKEGDLIPEFSIPLESGDTVSSATLKGNAVVLVFFATWCPPCLKELPHVQKEIWEKYKNHSDFRLFVVGREHTREELNAFKTNNKYTFPCIADTDRSIFSVFAKQNIPRMYLINKEGKIIKMNISFTPKLFNNFTDLLEKELD